MKTTFIALLRAVNVGGRIAPMQRVRATFEELGCDDVRTYIQSGNVFFTTSRTGQSDPIARTRLTRKIERALAEALGFEVPAMLRTPGELEASLRTNPFRGIPETPDVRFYVVFTSAPLPERLALPYEAPALGMSLLARTAGECFVLLRLVRGRSGSAAGFIEDSFSVQATARFFGTAGKILEAARAPARR